MNSPHFTQWFGMDNINKYEWVCSYLYIIHIIYFFYDGFGSVQFNPKLDGNSGIAVP
jgi:hypothetical protein